MPLTALLALGHQVAFAVGILSREYASTVVMTIKLTVSQSGGVHVAERQGCTGVEQEVPVAQRELGMPRGRERVRQRRLRAVRCGQVRDLPMQHGLDLLRAALGPFPRHQVSSLRSLICNSSVEQFNLFAASFVTHRRMLRLALPRQELAGYLVATNRNWKRQCRIARDFCS